jgi:hypothetical protein
MKLDDEIGLPLIEAGQEQARKYIAYLEEKETDFSFENLAEFGNKAVALLIDAFHSVYIPWVAHAIAEAKADAIDRAIDDEKAGDDQ